MATARRRGQSQEHDLYGPAKPAAWLSTMEMADISVEEQHRLATRRRRSALEDHADQNKILVADVERRFFAHPDRRFTDRAKALRWLAEHPQEPSGLNIRARRQAQLNRGALP